MTQYVKSTSFASKDALPQGNPLKIVKGTEIDTEFNNIAIAVATKADLLNPAFAGAPTAATAALGTSTTQIATTAFVQAALQAVYPVGSIYTSTIATDPGTTFGFGTWAAFGAGRVLVGQDTGDASFNSLEETGGSKTATLVSHTHTATVTDPGHAHSITTSAGGAGDFRVRDDTGGVRGTYATATAFTGITVANTAAGSSATNANLQPYVVVKMWKRTA